MAIYCARQNKFVAKLMHLVNNCLQGEIKLKGCTCLNSTILDGVKKLQLLIQNMTSATIMVVELTKNSSVFSDCEGIFYP